MHYQRSRPEARRVINARYEAKPESREKKRLRSAKPEAVAARSAYAKTPQGIAARKRARAAWLAKPGNREKERAAIKRWQATPEGAAKQLAAETRWRLSPEGRASRQVAAKKYAATPKNRVRMARHRALLQKAPINDLTVEDWLAVLQEFKGRCAYCGCDAPVEQDHVVPLSRGGSHTRDNVVPACRCCNGGKGSKLLSEWWDL